MAYLSFIDDDKLEEIVKQVLDSERRRLLRSETDKKLYRNVIDPFSILFEMSSFNLSKDAWLNNEQIRQAQKTLSNRIGKFHERMLGSLKGWNHLENQIVDIVCHSKKIIADIKNKHNTLKGSNQSTLYDDLFSLVMPKGNKYKDYTAYYVEIIPKGKKRYDEEFTPSVRNTGRKCEKNELIRKIDGYSFYALCTGVENALEQLFNVLPNVIENVNNGYTFSDKEFAKEFFKRAFGEKQP